MAAGTISAGYVMRGSDPLGERTGGGGSDPSSDGWVAFRSPAGSPRLERMYYSFASSSRLFRTNFLISFAGSAGTEKPCRSHSRSGIAYIVPTGAENPIFSARMPFKNQRRMVYHEIRREAPIGFWILPERHQRLGNIRLITPAWFTWLAPRTTAEPSRGLPPSQFQGRPPCRANAGDTM